MTPLFSAAADVEAQPPDHTPRHNHLSAYRLSDDGSVSPPRDFELISVEASSHCYRSLRDLLPPPPFAGTDIKIRNRLVKRAAWAYLRPASTATVSAEGSPFWLRVVRAVNRLCRSAIRAVDRTLHIIRIRTTR